LFANPMHSRDVIDRTVMWFGQYLGGPKSSRLLLAPRK
jgi:hypothetical protein